MKKTRIALIGCGYWGKNYVRVLQQQPNVQLVAVVDTEATAYSILQKTHEDVFFSTNENVVFNDTSIDAVVIASPVSQHFALCKKALTNKKHVLCEKPLAQTAPQVSELIELAKEQNLVLLPGHIFIYHDSIAFAKQYMDQVQLGNVQYITCQRTGLGPVREDVNVLFDLATHDISILLYLLGQMPVQVCATGMCYLQPGKEDVVTLQMLFSKNILANILVSWLHPQKVREIFIVGDKKMLGFNDVIPSEKLKIYDKGLSYQPNTGDYGQFQLSLRDGDIAIPNIKNTEPLQTEVADFLQAINEGAPTRVATADALRVLQVLEAAQLSLKENGKWIKL